MEQNRPMKIGVVCYPTYGGSGVIASEIGMAMARRGHQVHFVCLDLPRRLDRFMENIYFHEVVLQDYPLFAYPPYAIGLASKIVEVCTFEKLDILHVHYAVPHATSGYLACQVLGQAAPKLIATLHGTDITLVGNDRSYLPITRFSIEQCSGLTVPSQYLRNATYDKLNVATTTPIEVIPNFVDTAAFSPCSHTNGKDTQLLKQLRCSSAEKVIIHVSNFRPVKRIGDVIKIFAAARAKVPCSLILVGDGPERSMAEELARKLNISSKVSFLGKQEVFAGVLSNSDVFLMPSETESFGLAALEAMSCGVPAVTSNIHGLPEVVVDGETGFLCPVGDIDGMADKVVQILTDPDLQHRLGQAARKRAIEKFGVDQTIDRYERYYRQVIG